MKIKFLIGYPPKSYATEWQEIKRLPEEAKPDETTYLLFKALELNNDLDRELVKARRNVGLPEAGLSFDEYIKVRNHSNPVEEYHFYSYYDEVERIRYELSLHPQVEEQLSNLIAGYYVEPNYRGIVLGCSGANTSDYDSIEDFDENVEVDTVTIQLTKKVSKNELIKFIKSNWNGIDKMLTLLPEVRPFYLTERDMRIVELRDSKNLKYNQIAEQIVKEYSIDDITGSINEDSIKTSYVRAKTKIDDLAKLRKGNS